MSAHDDIPRTYRSGPSDPVSFGDGPGTWAEVTIRGSVDDVWALVSDPDTPARFSQELLGARWTSDGPALGASFVGRNQHEAVGEWETTSYIDLYEPGRVFGWAVTDIDNPGARWCFRLSPTADGVVLRFEASLGPGFSGTSMAIEARPDKETRIIDRRLREVHANIQRTVDGIRDLVEAG